MDSKNLKIVGLIFLGPLLMAPTCNHQVEFTGGQKASYCFEDVPVVARATADALGSLRGSAVLGLYNVTEGTGEVLQKLDINPGDSLAISATIPWSKLANHRGEGFAVVVDVGSFKRGTVTPGSTITDDTYYAALNDSLVFLYARATRSFDVCK